VNNPSFPPEWDKRNSPRHPVGVMVTIPPGEKKVMTRDLSLEGCFIPGLDLGPVGATVSIRIDIPGFGTLPLEGKVVHKGRENEGTGMEFISLTPEAIEWLDKFLSIFNP
jgi:hypothetical protein